jgi:hypothetical protein
MERSSSDDEVEANLRAALEAAEHDRVKYHVRAALQHLEIERNG